MLEKKTRAWTRLPSGRHFDLINPVADAWLDSDLSTRLSRTYRWSGESSWPLPISVAQHSLTVLALRQKWSNYTLSPSEALHELLHDSEEGFLGFDCNSPLKGVLGKPFSDVSNRIMDVICERYQLPSWTPEIYSLHKEADSISAASEAVHSVGWSHQEVREVLGITHPILGIDPLVELYDCIPWEPWTSELAAERFGNVLMKLLSRRTSEELTIAENLEIVC